MGKGKRMLMKRLKDNKKTRAKTRVNRQRPRFTMAGIAIFGPGVLNFCVRDGNRCDHSGIVTRSFFRDRSLKTE